MQEFSFIILNELILLIYLFSIAYYFFDFVKTHYKGRNICFVILEIVLVL
ncbi:cytochrome C assembly protein, partial [Staphylococcus equorum]